MDLKTKVKNIEKQLGAKGSSDPRWREKYAREHVRMARRHDEIYGKPKRPANEIIAEGIKELEYWPTEEAYLAHLEKMKPELDEMVRQVFYRAQLAAEAS